MTPGAVDAEASTNAATRVRLLEAAAELIGTQGLVNLTVRKLATAAGVSTMAIYTRFGGMPALVRAVVTEGFDRLSTHLAAVPQTDDVVDDLFQLGLAYRANALENPNLHAIMFGSSSLGGLVMDEELREIGMHAFNQLVAGVQRVLDAGRIREAPAEDVAGQLWSMLHGFVVLELTGWFDADDAERVLVPMMVNVAVGLGMS